MSLVLPYLLFIVIRNVVCANDVIQGFTMWEVDDFYYRAMAGIYLRVVYYSKDHSNLLNTERLTEIRDIEQQIKSWPVYHDRTLIYKEKDSRMIEIFDGPPNYLECPPVSAINYMFPETIDGVNDVVATGDGDTFAPEWFDVAIDADIYTKIWFNRDTYNADETSPFLFSYYPFGYKNGNDSRDDLIAFVESYTALLNGITSQNISILHSHSQQQPAIPETLKINEKIYRISGNISLIPTCYIAGYSPSKGVSSTRMKLLPNYLEWELSNYTYYFDNQSDTEFEDCRKKWPMYVADDNVDTIKFSNYRWNLVYNNTKYYCNVMVRNLSFCNEQWQSVKDGEYVDINVVIPVFDTDTQFSTTDNYIERTTDESTTNYESTTNETHSDQKSECLYTFDLFTMIIWSGISGWYMIAQT